jgi:ABC-type glycerol-3-phosphate transport system substrate-binding protein
LLDDNGGVVLDGRVAEEAVSLLATLAGKLPADAATWHYDDVDRALGEGRVAMAAAWPGGTEALRRGPVGDRLRPSAYPAGPSRRVSYAGCHGWAIPLTAGDVDGAVSLVTKLASEEAGRLEARSGAIPAHLGAAALIAPLDAIDGARLDFVREAISSQMATYPPHPRFAAFEDGGWRLVADVIAGRTAPEALAPALRQLAELTLGASE